ncbi:hypothetical protein AT15_06800 [Kosmotoga arenicorallina S304]|uniref:Uncharacterized protein n=1 Tax=Kosmotoga arenicorallina S304 TaxID=1453497 RepID=A0A176K208_9BACT|nr:DUF190 domain-containing protein [Kosmotoga arenicorallina]OAA31199.1 hypothetical protein AT15_06800 [Kosmotoga arenicorallina S304]
MEYGCLKIYFGEADKLGGKPAYEEIVKMAFEEGLKGATVYRGIMGFGLKRHLKRSNFFTLSEDLPVIIEIVDEYPLLEAFISRIKSRELDGLITLSKINYSYHK